MCILYNQRKTSVNNKLNITGNIINQQPTPIADRRRNLHRVILNMISTKQNVGSPSALRKTSDKNTDYLRNQEMEVLQKARLMSLPGINMC